MPRSAAVRVATLSHVAARIQAAAGDSADVPKKDGLPKLPAGFMQLHAVWKPSLEAETYTIIAKQSVKIKEGDTPDVIKNYISDDRTKKDQPQIFTVVAPQFSLPANSVHSYYPPDGHQDEGRVVPHIVLDDPVKSTFYSYRQRC
jgi:hypothetical protein